MREFFDLTSFFMDSFYQLVVAVRMDQVCAATSVAGIQLSVVNIGHAKLDLGGFYEQKYE